MNIKAFIEHCQSQSGQIVKPIVNDYEHCHLTTWKTVTWLSKLNPFWMQLHVACNGLEACKEAREQLVLFRFKVKVF